MFRLAILTFATASSACGPDPVSKTSTGLCDSFRERISNNPSAVAEAALKSGNNRFLAVAGFTTTVPGVEDENLIERQGYVILEGTTDSPTDTSCETYQIEATAYAQKYNARVLEKLGK